MLQQRQNATEPESSSRDAYRSVLAGRHRTLIEVAAVGTVFSLLQILLFQEHRTCLDKEASAVSASGFCRPLVLSNLLAIFVSSERS